MQESENNLPQDFVEELEQAIASNDISRLNLLRQEAKAERWAATALKLIRDKQPGALTDSQPKHSLLFSGHMIDRTGRKPARFPPSKEACAKLEIRRQLRQLKSETSQPLYGLAGGACGGDILFHETCLELSIPTTLYLAVPADRFINASVKFAGEQWVERFYQLYHELPVQILSENANLPKWLSQRKDYSIWQRTNEWMLQAALAMPGNEHSLLVLWDGQEGDGPGGTKQMIEALKELHHQAIIIDPLTLPENC